MKLRLKTNYYDYYDLAFNYGYEGPVYERIGGNTGPTKREQFRILEGAGFLTPPNGLVGAVLGEWWESENQRIKAVVAYTDEQAHCGEGKRLIRWGELKSNPDMGSPGGDRYWKEKQLYCSAFVGDQLYQPTGLSWRRLQIGRHVFWVEYQSAVSWMSNVDGDCRLIGTEWDVGFHQSINRPLFAVDFVLGKEMYAVDLNYGPGIRGSGVEDVLPAKRVVESIAEWFDEFGVVE